MQLLWASLNIAAFITFLRLGMEATKLLGHSKGRVASVIFVVLGLLVFAGQSGKKGQQERDVKKIGMMSGDSLGGSSFRRFNAELEDNWISRIGLSIVYGQDKDEKLVPTDAFSTRSGFTSGILRQPRFILVNVTQDGLGFDYKVTGTLEWKLLGATLYTQTKTYTTPP